jgi:hypothetical protein
MLSFLGKVMSWHCAVNGKGQLVTCHCRHRGEVEVYFCPHSTTALEKSGRSMPRLGRFSVRKNRRCHCTRHRKVDGPRASLESGIYLAPIRFRTTDLPVRIESLCRLRCPGPYCAPCRVGCGPTSIFI